MKKYIYTFIQHPLISGSVIIIVGSLFSSFLNFAYNLFMSRNLSISDYGILASLVSFINIASLPAGALIPVLVSFAASYFAKKEYDQVRGLYHRVGKFTFIASVIIFSLLIIFRQPIGHFFNITNSLLIIYASFTVLIGFNQTVNVSLLQAKLSFGYISMINLMGSLAKFLIGVLFVFMGYAVDGAMIAFILSYSIPFFLSFIPLRFLFQSKETPPQINTKELLSYGVPSAIALFALTSFITTDIILVKHFWDPQQAGIYAGLALIGKVIFFISAPIGTVMFPLITQKYERGEKYENTLFLAIFLVGAPSLLLTTFYFLFPDFVIQFFLKKVEYLQAAPYVGLFGIFISLYAMLTILVNLFLSIKKTKIAYFVVICALLQGICIWFYHTSFLQIIEISINTASLLFLGLIVYYLKMRLH